MVAKRMEQLFVPGTTMKTFWKTSRRNGFCRIIRHFSLGHDLFKDAHYSFKWRYFDDSINKCGLQRSPTCRINQVLIGL